MKINENKKIKNDIIEGTISLTIATIIVKVLGAVYKIPISNILGEEGMGYFNSAYTVYSFFYLICTAGVPKAVMILIGENKEEPIFEFKIMSAAIRFFTILGVVISLMFLIFSNPISIVIGSRESYKTMLAIAPSILFVSVSGVLRGYLSAHTKFFHVAISQVIEGAGKLLFGIIFATIADRLYLPLNVMSAFTIFGVTCSTIVGLVYLLINSKKAKASEKTKQNNVVSDKDIIKDILKISFPITISAAIMSITNMIDLALIMRQLISAGYSESNAAALYGNYTTYATPMFNLVVSLLTPITIAFFPSLIKVRKNSLEFSKTLEKEFFLIFWISIPITLGMCVYRNEVLNLLFKGGGLEIGGSLLMYLSLSLFFVAPLLVLNSALESFGDTKAPMISMIIGSIFKIVVSYFMISNPKFGIFGAPIGTLVSYIVAFSASLFIAHKQRGISPPIIKTIALPAINSFLAVFAIYPIYLKLQIKSDIKFLISVIATVALYILLSFFTDAKSELLYFGRKTIKRKQIRH